MEVNIFNLENEVVGNMVLASDVFGMPESRGDIVSRVIDWQLKKRMSGTHQTKTISMVSGTTRKPFKQKGTGNARQGSLRAVQMRGGAVAHGPVVRSHEVSLPKKVRKLGLKCALSEKLKSGKLFICDSLSINSPKTSLLLQQLSKFNNKRSFFIVDGDTVDQNLSLAVQNILGVSFVPQIGANVYDIIKHDCLILSRAAVEALEKRLK